MTRAEAGTRGASVTLPRSSEPSASDPAVRDSAFSCHPSASAQKSVTGASGTTVVPFRAAAQVSPS